MARYSIGVDYGTESARALLLHLDSAIEVASSAMKYPHGVMDDSLPDGTPLPQDWALQHPDDYLAVLAEIIPDLLRQAGVSKEDVVGFGIDFTACTALPVKKDGTPLCDVSGFERNPHAYVKLWKHHAAQPEANRLNAVASMRGERFLMRYGGKISSEWLVPKVWQVLNEAPDVYAAADMFMEATDWVIMRLTGRETRNSCTAGYKAIWHKRDGFPGNDFYRDLDPRLEYMVDEKLSRDILPIGSKAGELTEAAAKHLGLRPGVAVAVGNVDAHVSVPAMGVTEPGNMVMIMGTSICHMVLGDREVNVPGMCGVVEDGILPGLFGYEAGQSAVGDIFGWFVDNCVPRAYEDEATALGVDVFGLLESKASNLKPGESGLLALDWWNGNRSILVDADLTGMILGLTLATKPEAIFRSLVEATAFGTKTIIDAFAESGIEINGLYACGGLPEKNPLLMQVFSDVTGLEIRTSQCSETPALGAAMFGAVAAGKERGGFDSIFAAAEAVPRLKDYVYRPIPENVQVYKRLSSEYKRLHDHFGRGQNQVMKVLKDVKESVLR